MPRRRQRTTDNQGATTTPKSNNEGDAKSSKTRSVTYLLVVLCIALGLSYFHFQYIYRLFESERHFSHLSTMERELSFRTEMGLYYSYFKDVALDAPSFTQGFLAILSDNRTEAPTTINVLERFNLYPEVLLSLLYRSMNSRGLLTQVCYRVDRGEGMPSVSSCEGHQEPTYFYVTCVFLLNGLMLGALFLFATYLSKSLLGGLLTVAAYMFNHGEATRVMWTPPLRENFAFPFHIVQLFALTFVLKQQRTLMNGNPFDPLVGHIKKHDLPVPDGAPPSLAPRKHKLLLVCLLTSSTVLYMLPWQFAQFALATQLLSLGVLFTLDLLPFEQFFFIICTQLLSLIISAVLMFGNRMLLTSLFSITLFTFYLVCLGDALFRSSFLQSNRLLIVVRRMLLFVAAFVLIKGLIINKLLKSPDDDAHIWDILKSKLSSSYKTFDTQLYTCAKEFDFTDKETITKLSLTGLLPLSFLVIARIAFGLLIDVFRTDASGDRRVWYYYHVIQAGAYLLMGIFIMRLKLFPVPQLCVLLSLFMDEQLWPKRITSFKRWKLLLFVLLVSAMAVQGRKNIQEQLTIKGEYLNYPMEKMVHWVNANTANDSIFAGTMPTMANLKLSTGRAIVLHPHYEHAKIRRRVKLVYTMFSRKPLRHIHSILKELQVDYYVFESHWCTITNRPTGCSFPEMYDLDEEDERILRRTTLACETLQSNPQPYFKKLFTQDYLSIYAVL